MKDSNIQFGIKALIVHNNRYLAVHKAKIEDCLYELPGGRMLFGETIEETVQREVKEELNLVIKPIRLVDTWNYMREDQKHQVTGVIYYCEVIGGFTNLKLSQEHNDFKWFDIKDVSKMNVLFKNKMECWDWFSILKKA